MLNKDCSANMPFGLHRVFRNEIGSQHKNPDWTLFRSTAGYIVLIPLIMTWYKCTTPCVLLNNSVSFFETYKPNVSINLTRYYLLLGVILTLYPNVSINLTRYYLLLGVILTLYPNVSINLTRYYLLLGVILTLYPNFLHRAFLICCSKIVLITWPAQKVNRSQWPKISTAS